MLRCNQLNIARLLKMFFFNIITAKLQQARAAATGFPRPVRRRAEACHRTGPGPAPAVPPEQFYTARLRFSSLGRDWKPG